MQSNEDTCPHISFPSPSASDSVAHLPDTPTVEVDEPLAVAFGAGLLPRMLEEYIALCHPPREADESRPRSRPSPPVGERFPNLAGFCRFLGCSTEEWLQMEREHPVPFGRLRAVLEDEALNASLSPTVIGAYLKKRLGYDKEGDPRAPEQMTVRFEHDIWEDGE